MLGFTGRWSHSGYRANNILFLMFFIFMNRFLYKSSQCLAACPIGTYEGDSIIKECLDCPDNCLRCTNSGQKCEVCSMDHFLVADLRQCVKSCGEGESLLINFFFFFDLQQFTAKHVDLKKVPRSFGRYSGIFVARIQIFGRALQKEGLVTSRLNLLF